MKSKYIKPVVFSALCLSMGFSARGGITAGNKDNPLTPFNKGDNEEIVFTFGDKEVRKAEFVSVYEKNNTISGHFDEKSLKEYLELYIKFKLKVQQAKDMQLDTLSSIHAEFTKYRKQISKSYLSDKQFKDKLIEKVYEKLKTEIKASHIMIKLAANTSDEDSLSLAAYNKIMDARNRILKGEDFGEVALEVSQDPSAKTNKGNLGYFSAFEMVYDFEEAAYHTKVGAISMPVRTGFGYHILKVEDKRPSRGKILTAHIFVKLNQKATEEEQNKAKQRIDDYYKKIKSGTSTFEAIVIESSDDQVSVKKGGELYWIGVTSWRRRMLPAFEDAAFSLKNNDDISEPVQTRFGWHIIKRIDKKDLSPLEEIRKELGGKIDKDAERSKTIRKAFIENVKKEYNFTQFAKPKEKLLATIDESILKGEWQAAKPSKLKKTLFTLLDKKYTQLNFARFIEKRQPKKSKAPIKNIFNDLYQQFIDKSCIDFEESRLEIKYPEFKTLMDEYKEGILLFELMDRKVWSKAVEDTTGIKEFFKTHNTDTLYMWKERLGAIIYQCANENVYKKVRSFLLSKKDISNQVLLMDINTQEQPKLLTIEQEAKYEQGENAIIDQISWEIGLNKKIINSDGSISLVQVTGKFDPESKTFEEAKGYIVSAYQEYLEKQWIDSLYKKYPVKVNQVVFKSLIK